MKEKIHPQYMESTIICSCGNTWTTRSTRKSLRTDLCSNCHPFYTGEQRIVDTAGQVDRFMRRLQTSQQQQADAARRREEKNKPAPKKPSLLKEIYGEDEA